MTLTEHWEQRGVQKGRQEAREEGKRQVKQQMAKKLLDIGMPLEEIAYATELPLEELVTMHEAHREPKIEGSQS